jgi:DNA-binding CsgD family transcriptional regulator
MGHYESLLDAIDLAYQAAVEPSLWPRVLAATADCFDAPRALLFPERGTGGMTLSSQADEPLADTYFAKFQGINPIQQALDRRLGSAHPPAFTDQDLMAKRALVHSEFYHAFLRPADMHGIMMMPLGGSVLATVNVIRSRRAPEFERREIELALRLRQSLHRAWTMGVELGAQRAVDEALADFIDRLPGAVLLVSADGRIAHANARAQAIAASRDGLSAPAGILEAASLPARQQLRRLIAQAAAGDAERRSGGAMAVPRPSGRRPFAVQVAPARGEPALIAYRSPLALVCISDPEAQPRLTTERLRDVFGLTAAESRIAIALFEGSSLREAAGAAGVSLVTVRNQLASIFEKIGVNRQSALIAQITRALFAQLD